MKMNKGDWVSVEEESQPICRILGSVDLLSEDVCQE